MAGKNRAAFFFSLTLVGAAMIVYAPGALATIDCGVQIRCEGDDVNCHYVAQWGHLSGKATTATDPGGYEVIELSAVAAAVAPERQIMTHCQQARVDFYSSWEGEAWDNGFCTSPPYPCALSTYGSLSHGWGTGSRGTWCGGTVCTSGVSASPIWANATAMQIAVPYIEANVGGYANARAYCDTDGDGHWDAVCAEVPDSDNSRFKIGLVPV